MPKILESDPSSLEDEFKPINTDRVAELEVDRTAVFVFGDGDVRDVDDLGIFAARAQQDAGDLLVGRDGALPLGLQGEGHLPVEIDRRHFRGDLCLGYLAQILELIRHREAGFGFGVGAFEDRLVHGTHRPPGVSPGRIEESWVGRRLTTRIDKRDALFQTLNSYHDEPS